MSESEVSAAFATAEHDRTFNALTELMQELGALGITKENALPAFADFMLSVALIVGGAPLAREMIERLNTRIEQWQAKQRSEA